MAQRTSGERPVNSEDEAIEGQQDGIVSGSGRGDREQTLSDGEQTLADSDQTLSDADQTSADADQTSADADQTSADNDQSAADSDQAASDRDLEAGDVGTRAHDSSRDTRELSTRQRVRSARNRDETAQARLTSAGNRDAIARARDVAALARDRAAEARDLALGQLEAACERDADLPELAGSEKAIRAAGQRKRAAQRRAHAAEQRVGAAEDRQAAAQDREQAAQERLRALVDREALARHGALVETDPLTGARMRAAGLMDLDHEVQRCHRAGGRLVAAFVEAVGPETTDGSEGRGVGNDLLLKRVAWLIGTDLRAYDLIIRLGGNEFLVAMSAITLAEGRRRLAAIADALEAAPDAGAIRVGLAELEPGESADELIARAESARIEGHADRP